MSELGPFDFVNSITETKEHLGVDAASSKAYNAFLVNRALSYFPDTLMLAEEMSYYRRVPTAWQYEFLFHAVRQRRRRSRWGKKRKDDDIDAVMKVYECGRVKAAEIVSILSEDQLASVKKKLEMGGVRNASR